MASCAFASFLSVFINASVAVAFATGVRVVTLVINALFVARSARALFVLSASFVIKSASSLVLVMILFDFNYV